LLITDPSGYIKPVIDPSANLVELLRLKP
jgi:hypothetical protein